MKKPNPAAQALAKARWANTTPEQRKEATKAATAASPRTKALPRCACGHRRMNHGLAHGSQLSRCGVMGCKCSGWQTANVDP